MLGAFCFNFHSAARSLTADPQAAQPMQCYLLNIQGHKRDFWVYSPPHDKRDQAWPVLVAFHGFRMNAQSMADVTGLNQLANRENFLVVYPNGRDRQWNGKAVANNNTEDIEFVDAMLQRLKTFRQVNSNRIFAAGFSNGGFLVQRLACEMPGRFAAYATVAATMGRPLSQACKPSPSTPLLMIHGTDDPVVTWEGEIRRIKIFFRSSKILSVPETVNFWRQANHCQPNVSLKYKVDHQPDDAMAAEHLSFSCPQKQNLLNQWILFGGGHTWPGNKDEHGFNRWLMGRTSRDIDASQEIWNFFKPFHLPTVEKHNEH